MTEKQNQISIIKEYDNRNELEFKTPAMFKNQLEHGKYDINYVITLLKIILNKCNAHLMSAKDLQFTLVQSLTKLIAMLETERDDSIPY